jgi:hypothetical protein
MPNLDEATVAALIKMEQARTIDNILTRLERPKNVWWLSFADNDGFRGAVIIHGEDFLTALMECNMRKINPHGECQGAEFSEEGAQKIPEHWKNRILSHEECEQFDREMDKL